jgi:hypothetical protein
MLVLAPEFVAILEAIEIVECVGDRQAACERNGTPKIGYPSAAYARRALLLWSWYHKAPITAVDVIYSCTWCGDWHHGRDRRREVEALAA